MVDLETDLEKLEIKEEKVKLLREIILNEKTEKKTKEKAIDLLNKFLKQEQGLEKKVEFSKVKEEDIIPEKIGSLTQKSKQEYKKEENIQKSKQDHVYSRDKNTILKNLRISLGQKGLLKLPNQNNFEIKQEIYDYFGGNIGEQKIENYANLLSGDKIEYQIFGKDIKEWDPEKFLKVGGQEKKYYKVKNEFS
jgi:hypothetical protein